MEDCVFCKIIAGVIPCYKIYEDEFVLAFLDIACDGYGHTLVVPKKHCENILDADEFTYNKVLNAVKFISNHYVKHCGFSGVNIMNASGKDAEQSVFHLHFHIFPRENNDGISTWPKLEKQTFDLEKIRDVLKII